IALLGGEDRSAEPARFPAPAAMAAEYVQRIARREPRQSCQPAVHQPVQRRDALRGARDLIEPPRSRAQRLPDPQLQSVELRPRLAAGVAVTELTCERRQALSRREAGQLPQHLGELMRQQAEWHHPARADLEMPFPIDVHLTIPAEAARVNVDGLYHRPLAADHGA